MRGYLRLAFLGANGRRLPVVVHHHGAAQVSAVAPETVIVRPGGYAYVLLGRSICADSPIGNATRMRVMLPGSSTARTGPAFEGFGLGWCARSDPEFRLVLSAIASSMRGVAAFWHRTLTADEQPGFWGSFKRWARLKQEDLGKWPTTFRFPTDCKDAGALEGVTGGRGPIARHQGHSALAGTAWRDRHRGRCLRESRSRSCAVGAEGDAPGGREPHRRPDMGCGKHDGMSSPGHPEAPARKRVSKRGSLTSCDGG